MRRPLSGSLEHLAPPALLRLVSATTPSGVLELETAAGSLRLEVRRGRVAVPTAADLEEAGMVLASRSGEFRFTPGKVGEIDGEALTLTAYAEAATGAASDLELENLFQGEFLELPPSTLGSNIHVLPSEPLPNPLDNLLADLEVEAPGGLPVSQIGVFAQDPRWWKGSLERKFLRLGWEIRLFESLEQVESDGLDVLVIHHQQAAARAGREDEWLGLVAAAEEPEVSVPVVWIAPLGDPDWVHRLIESGVSFLMPAPQGEGGEAVARFGDDVSRIVGRHLKRRPSDGHSSLPPGIAELVGALLSESDSDQGLGLSSLLHLAAREFDRGAVLTVENSSIRCRAGFGYALNSAMTALPRGIGCIEEVLSSGQAQLEIEPESSGARLLADALGIESLPPSTAVIPLGRSGREVGVLVADRLAKPLPDIADLVLLVGRLGGVVDL